MKIETQREPIVGSYSGLDQKQAACEADVSQNLAWRGATTIIIFIPQSTQINDDHNSISTYQ